MWSLYLLVNKFLKTDDENIQGSDGDYYNGLLLHSHIVEHRSVSGEEISLFILSGKYIAIVLVDQHKLSRSWLEDLCVSGFYEDSSDYTGHYIVICGYDAVRDEFEIRDPASSKKHEKVPLKCLEEARKSFGTDEDLLLISLEKCRFGNISSGKLSPEADTGL